MAWATLTQARSHWADAANISDATLTTLLDVATVSCQEYAPELVRVFDDAITVLGSTVLKVVSPAFSVLDVGAAITGNGLAVGTTIASRQTKTQVTLSAAATASATSVEITVTRSVPNNYMLATVYQAREIYAASLRGEQDVIGIGDYAIRARPLTAAVKQLLRPQTGPVIG